MRRSRAKMVGCGCSLVEFLPSHPMPGQLGESRAPKFATSFVDVGSTSVKLAPNCNRNRAKLDRDLLKHVHLVGPKSGRGAGQVLRDLHQILQGAAKDRSNMTWDRPNVGAFAESILGQRGLHPNNTHKPRSEATTADAVPYEADTARARYTCSHISHACNTVPLVSSFSSGSARCLGDVPSWASCRTIIDTINGPYYEEAVSIRQVL